MSFVTTGPRVAGSRAAAQAVTSSQRTYASAGSAGSRPLVAAATSTAPSSVRRTKRPARLPNLMPTPLAGRFCATAHPGVDPHLVRRAHDGSFGGASVVARARPGGGSRAERAGRVPSPVGSGGGGCQGRDAVQAEQGG